MINYISNIDTICILVNIENYEENCRKLIQHLLESRERAKVNDKDNLQHKELLTINDITFQILPNSCKGYACILRNDDYELKISQYKI